MTDKDVLKFDIVVDKVKIVKSFYSFDLFITMDGLDTIINKPLRAREMIMKKSSLTS